MAAVSMESSTEERERGKDAEKCEHDGRRLYDRRRAPPPPPPVELERRSIEYISPRTAEYAGIVTTYEEEKEDKQATDP